MRRKTRQCSRDSQTLAKDIAVVWCKVTRGTWSDMKCKTDFSVFAFWHLTIYGLTNLDWVLRTRARKSRSKLKTSFQIWGEKVEVRLFGHRHQFLYSQRLKLQVKNQFRRIQAQRFQAKNSKFVPQRFEIEALI